MELKYALELLPNTKGCVVVLSGGLDSSAAMRLAVEKYGAENVSALTFFYGQKQADEIKCAEMSTTLLGVTHKVINAEFLGDISQGFSANVDTNIAMPTIQDVIGDCAPKTYVPNRNMILMSIAAAYAEVQGLQTVICGLQVHDRYGYHDTTQEFVDALNACLIQNRKHKIKIIAPFSQLSKTEELDLLVQMDSNLDLVAFTLTCYNPEPGTSQSCGKCPSCAERIQAFMNINQKDPIPYQTEIPWRTNDT